MWDRIELIAVKWRDTKIGIIEEAECEFCGAINLKWEDERIECKYCGEMV